MNVDMRKIAEQIAEKYAFIAKHNVYDYDFDVREYDGMIELLCLVEDPTLTKTDKNYILENNIPMPKRWLTAAVLHPEEQVNV